MSGNPESVLDRHQERNFEKYFQRALPLPAGRNWCRIFNEKPHKWDNVVAWSLPIVRPPGKKNKKNIVKQVGNVPNGSRSEIYGEEEDFYLVEHECIDNPCVDVDVHENAHKNRGWVRRHHADKLRCTAADQGPSRSKVKVEMSDSDSERAASLPHPGRSKVQVEMSDSDPEVAASLPHPGPEPFTQKPPTPPPPRRRSRAPSPYREEDQGRRYPCLASSRSSHDRLSPPAQATKRRRVQPAFEFASHSPLRDMPCPHPMAQEIFIQQATGMFHCRQCTDAICGSSDRERYPEKHRIFKGPYDLQKANLRQ